MSAAATAAGYLYASGRLRGRNARESEQGHAQEPEQKPKPYARRREVKVAVYQPEPGEREPREREPRAAVPAERPKAAPKIQYRTRRWKPE
jgi:hypothetical protein